MTQLTTTAPGATKSIRQLPAAFANHIGYLTYPGLLTRWGLETDGTITLHTPSGKGRNSSLTPTTA
jgi:hypothetical protein